ncbi:MAG: hypothetical protein ABW003_17275 [Microvirga sp.]
MIRYYFKEDPAPIQGVTDKEKDAQKIGEALAALARDAGGELRPPRVVMAAKAEDHPLHPHFEWRDRIAANKYRLDQARTLIRVIREDDAYTGKPVRSFLSVTTKHGGVSYRTVGDVQTSADLQVLVLKAAERDLAAFEARYDELKDVCMLVKAAKSRVRKRRETLETRPSV